MSREFTENPDNIQFLCAKHAPKPINYEGDLNALVGKHVKRRFHQEFEDHANVEHMWVKVREVTQDEEGSTVLAGTLDNEPVYMEGLQLGDEVHVYPDEIEEVC